VGKVGGLVNLPPRHPVVLGEPFRLLPHGLPGEGVGKPVPQEDVLEVFRGAQEELVPPPGPVGEVEARLAHGLHPPGEDEVGLPGAEELDGVERRHHPRGADHVHLVPVHLLGDARLQGRLPGEELPVPGPEDVAEDVEVQGLSLHPRPGQGLPHGVGAEVHGAYVLEDPPELADGGPHRGDNVHLAHAPIIRRALGVESPWEVPCGIPD